MFARSHFSIALAVFIAAPLAGAEPCPLVYVEGSTKKVCQLTGDFDRERGVDTLSQTGKYYGVAGTDLGSSFEHKGRLYFLFGDTWGRPGSRDVLGWTTGKKPEEIRLEFHRADDTRWLPITVPGVSLGPFEIPSYGISVDGKIYAVFTTDHSNERTMGRSVLAVSSDDGRTFQKLYDLSEEKFINVAFWNADEWLYLFGSGDYRRSSVCLARVRPNELSERDKLQYFVGLDEMGEPRWSPVEEDAVVLFRHDVVGEFSVTFCEPVSCYVMLYNAVRPRGITMRSAPAPWGPWSEGTVIFHPFRDKGYGHFMHFPGRRPEGGRPLNDPRRALEPGGEYGPYIVSRFTSGTADRCRLVYTMSTWNPYQVVVMESEFRLEE